MFAKRAKPVPRRNSMRSDDEEEVEELTTVTTSSIRRRLLSVDADEDAPTFKVKKSKLSKHMTKTKSALTIEKAAPAAAAAVEVVADDEDDGDSQPALGFGQKAALQRKNSRGGLRAAATSRAASQSSLALHEVPDMPEDTAESQVVPGPADDDEESDGELAKAGEAARMARARRAAAREIYGKGVGDLSVEQKADYIPLSGKVQRIPLMPDGGVDAVPKAGSAVASPFEEAKSPSLSALVARCNMALSSGEKEDDAEADAWAMQQMRVGAHKRKDSAAAPADAFDADPVAPAGPVPAARRDQVPKRKDKMDTGVHETSTKASSKIKTPSEAMALLWETLGSLEGGIGERNRRTVELDDQQKDAEGALEDLKKEEKKLEKALRTSQELEEFSNSLGGLLDAKAPMQKQAADTLARMEQDFAARRQRRRVRCFVADVQGAGAALSVPRADDVEDVVSADRRQKRWQRRRQRSSACEGWDTSSASEDDGHSEFAQDRAAFCQAAHQQIQADVDESYGSISALLKPLRGVKEKLPKEYSQAFVPAALPEALAMHAEHLLLWWDPLQTLLPKGGGGGEEPAPPKWGPRRCVASAQLEDFDWFADLAEYTELAGEEDPDAELVPQLVRRCVFPNVARRLRDCWDVASAAQSRQVASLLDECLLFETDPSASSFAPLLEAAMKRLETGLADFVPEVFVANGELERWYGSSARRRFLWRSCKIARCACMLEGRLPDEPLAAFVLTGIFGKRIAPHLRAPRLDPGEMDVVERFVSSLPERWLERGLPPVLQPLRDAIGPRAPGGPEAAQTARIAGRVLKRMRCYDEAQVLLGSD